MAKIIDIYIKIKESGLENLNKTIESLKELNNVSIAPEMAKVAESAIDASKAFTNINDLVKSIDENLGSLQNIISRTIEDVASRIIETATSSISKVRNAAQRAIETSYAYLFLISTTTLALIVASFSKTLVIMIGNVLQSLSSIQSIINVFLPNVFEISKQLINLYQGFFSQATIFFTSIQKRGIFG